MSPSNSMEFRRKSAFIAGCFVLCLYFLSACSDEQLAVPKVFGGIEVPAPIMAEPRLVQQPADTNYSHQPWPLVGAVPAKPQTFSPKPVTDQAMSEMEFDRSQSRKTLNEYEAMHPDQADDAGIN